MDKNWAGGVSQYQSLCANDSICQSIPWNLINVSMTTETLLGQTLVEVSSSHTAL
jgi:hypothetical protein